MRDNPANQWQNKLYTASLILAPLLLLVTSIAEWTGDGPEKDGLGGTLKVITFFLFIFVVMALTKLLWTRAPRTAVIGRFFGILGCAGGIGYGFLGVFHHVLIRTGANETLLTEFQSLANGFDGGMTGVPILQIPGIIFPLSMLGLGTALWRTRAVPAWVGILVAVSGLMFPLGRFPDVAAVNYLADLLFIISLGRVALHSRSTAGPDLLAAEAA